MAAGVPDDRRASEVGIEGYVHIALGEYARPRIARGVRAASTKRNEALYPPSHGRSDVSAGVFTRAGDVLPGTEPASSRCFTVVAMR
jgi:hypothetical protein